MTSVGFFLVMAKNTFLIENFKKCSQTQAESNIFFWFPLELKRVHRKKGLRKHFFAGLSFQRLSKKPSENRNLPQLGLLFVRILFPNVKNSYPIACRICIMHIISNFYVKTHTHIFKNIQVQAQRMQAQRMQAQRMQAQRMQAQKLAKTRKLNVYEYIFRSIWMLIFFFFSSNFILMLFSFGFIIIFEWC